MTRRENRKADSLAPASVWRFRFRQVEFDTPANLLANAKGHFRALVDASSDRAVLLEIVEEKKRE